MSSDEVMKVIRGEPLNRSSGDEPDRPPSPPRRGASVPTTEGKGDAPGGIAPEPQPGG